MSGIYVAGHTGLVGSALVRRLKSLGQNNLILRTHEQLDLTRQEQVEDFFFSERPSQVFLAAARVGGIWANSKYPAEFIYENLAIQTNVIHAAWKAKVERLLFLGSSCIYPRDCPQPMKEEYLMSGPLEPTNEPYALAKIAGIIMCRSYNLQHATRFICVMPTNLYGPQDNFDLETSHVLPALIRKFHLANLAARGDWAAIEADQTRFGLIPPEYLSSLIAICRSHGHPVHLPTPDASTVSYAPKAVKPNHEAYPAVSVWGTGKVRREFMHVDDMADACVFLMQLPDRVLSELFEPPQPCFLNIGTGLDCKVEELAQLVAEVVGCEVPIRFDPSKPEGTPRKLLDVSRLRSLGWKPKIQLREGLASTYSWYVSQFDS